MTRKVNRVYRADWVRRVLRSNNAEALEPSPSFGSLARLASKKTLELTKTQLNVLRSSLSKRKLYSYRILTKKHNGARWQR